MLALRRRSPFEGLSALHREIDQVFDRLLDGRSDWWTDMVTAPRPTPALDAYVEGDQFHVRAELPGVDPDAIEVSVLGNQLIIKGERKATKESKDEGYYLREIAYGSFERAVALPEGANADQIKARYENGVLHITMPVKAAFLAKKVPIEVAAEEQRSLKAA
jgi:HSP20 family protein